MAYHHNTIRKYTAALLDLFNNIEIKYKKSDNSYVSKNVPISYSSREKASYLDDITTEQLNNGNYNVLPKASLTLSGLSRDSARNKNKNIKTNFVKNTESYDYAYNSVSYTFGFDLTILCRGMNEASMIVEQVLPLFNPTYYIDVWDASNLDEPTRIPIKLNDVSIESEEYDFLTSNITTVVFNLELLGNMYPPIKSVEKIKEFKMVLNEDDTKKSILGWDVNSEQTLENEKLTQFQDNEQIQINIIDVVTDGFSIGESTFSVIYTYGTDIETDLTFEWSLLRGEGVLVENNSYLSLTVDTNGVYEISVKITDVYGNFAELNKTFILGNIQT